VLKQPCLVLREARRVEGRVHDIQVQEPLEQQVVLQPFAKLPLAADRVERDQQARLEQVLGRYRRAPHVGVHSIKRRRELLEGLVDDRFDPPDGVVRWHQIVGRQGAEHGDLLFLFAAHDGLLRLSVDYSHSTTTSRPNQLFKQSFSAAC
jgi:hypothetical protein